MEGLIGIAFNDFVLVAADKSMTFSILSIKQDVDKIVRLDDRLLLAVCGEPGDTTQFAELMQKNVKLYSIRNGFPLSPESAAHFVRRNLADSLRSRSPYQVSCSDPSRVTDCLHLKVNCLLAGYDHVSGTPELFHMDYLAACVKLPFAMHGYAAFVGTSIMDRHYRPDSTLAEGLDLMRKVVAEVHKRLIINMPSFTVKVVDKEGIRDLADIKIDVQALGI